MPRLWKDTIESHRRDVRAAILETAWTMATERGARGVTMGAVAAHSGIARATLYKYFGGVDEMLIAAHAEHVAQHLNLLHAVRDQAASVGDGLRGLLAGYAQICFDRGSSATTELHGLVHRGEEHEGNREHLAALFTAAVRDAQDGGQVRTDVGAEELAGYCLHALEAAAQASAESAVDRLLDLVAETLHLHAAVEPSAKPLAR